MILFLVTYYFVSCESSNQYLTIHHD